MPTFSTSLPPGHGRFPWLLPTAAEESPPPARENDKDYVQLGVFRVEGDRLLWVRGEWVDARAYDEAKGGLSSRPKGFTTKPIIGKGFQYRQYEMQKD
jgi:hypothetical protein